MDSAIKTTHTYEVFWIQAELELAMFPRMRLPVLWAEIFWRVLSNWKKGYMVETGLGVHKGRVLG